MLDLSLKKKVADAKHWSNKISQLYHPTGTFAQDSHDLVYATANLNITKFTPILLKEWYFLVQKGGYLVIDYQPNDNCDFRKLEELMWWLWKTKYEIIYHGPVQEKDLENLEAIKLAEFIKSHEHDPNETRDNPKGMLRFICQKTEYTSIPNDSIDSWTFGIITNGKRREWVEIIIESIRKQKIPSYEIIICGNYDIKSEGDITYLPFSRRDDKGWITKKKNLIAKTAKYENLCILHDRMTLHNDWFEGMKKWGNCFEVLSIEQKSALTGETGNQWEYSSLLLYKKLGRFLKQSLLNFNARLDASDWFESIILPGQVIICKKSIYLAHPQNETLYWSEQEDHIFSRDLVKAGYIIRYNSQSLFINLDNKRWSNNTEVIFSKEPGEVNYKGPVQKLLFRKLISALLARLRKYNLE